MHFVFKSALSCRTAARRWPCPAVALFYEAPSTPLHQAAWKGDLEAVRALVEAGADINSLDANGGTPLHWAARGGHALGPHRCRGEAADRPPFITALLELGADPNIRDGRPRIPGPPRAGHRWSSPCTTSNSSRPLFSSNTAPTRISEPTKGRR